MFRVRRGRTSSPPFEGRGPTEAPGHSLSPRPPGASGAGASGPAQTSGSPAVPSVRRNPRPSRAPRTPAVARTPTARALGHRDDPGATPDAQDRAGAGPSSGTLTRQPLLPVCRCRCLAFSPAACSRGGVRAGAASPPDPPRVRAARGPDPVRGAAAAAATAAAAAAAASAAAAAATAAAAAPFPFLPPPSVRPSHRGPPRISWIRSRLELGKRTVGFQDSCLAPSLARHKDGAAGDCRRRCRETSPLPPSPTHTPPQQLEGGSRQEKWSIRAA